MSLLDIFCMVFVVLCGIGMVSVLVFGIELRPAKRIELWPPKLDYYPCEKQQPSSDDGGA